MLFVQLKVLSFSILNSGDSRIENQIQITKIRFNISELNAVHAYLHWLFLKKWNLDLLHWINVAEIKPVIQVHDNLKMPKYICLLICFSFIPVFWVTYLIIKFLTNKLRKKEHHNKCDLLSVFSISVN